MSVGAGRLVLFDVGETLLHPSPSWSHHFGDVCAAAGVVVDGDRVEAVFRREIARFAARVAGHDGGEFSTSDAASFSFWTTLYAQTLAELGVAAVPPDLPARLYARFCDHDTYDVFDDTHAALDACEAAGWAVGVVSNWEAWLGAMLAAKGLRARLACCVISGEVGIEKPDRAIYLRALAEAGIDPAAVTPDTVVMVGDSWEADVEPALALGMTAVLLDRHDRHAHRDTPDAAHVRVTTLHDLAAVLPA